MSVPLLATLLAAEHAAVYGYGVLGARLDEQVRPMALAAFDSHRARRDQLIGLLRERGAVPDAPPASYDVAVMRVAQALALAVRLEEGLAVRWRDLVAGAEDRSLRGVAVGGLQETAVRAAQWRLLLGDGAITVALPGTV